MSIRGKAAIVGFYELPTRKEMPDRTTYGLLAEVTRGAILDAGLKKDDIDGLITPEQFNSLTIAEALGLQPRFNVSMTTHGASGATSIATAAEAIAAGVVDMYFAFSESHDHDLVHDYEVLLKHVMHYLLVVVLQNGKFRMDQLLR